jgi:circadian clock protein KaiB
MIRDAHAKAMKTTPLRLVRKATVATEARQSYVFHLYIVGNGLNSMRAVECVKRLCAERLGGRSCLHIIDLGRQPALAKSENIVAIPTLIRKFPLPVVRMIGDMSDTRSLLRDDDRREMS